MNRVGLRKRLRDSQEWIRGTREPHTVPPSDSSTSQRQPLTVLCYQNNAERVYRGGRLCFLCSSTTVGLSVRSAALGETLLTLTVQQVQSQKLFVCLIAKNTQLGPRAEIAFRQPLLRSDTKPRFYSLRTSCHPDDGGAKFFRNVGSYRSHTA
jgi:hypothetical protein